MLFCLLYLTILCACSCEIASDIDEKPSKDTLRRNGTSFGDCLKACMLEKEIRCGHFHFQRRTKVCYLLELDETRVVPIGFEKLTKHGKSRRRRKVIMDDTLALGQKSKYNGRHYDRYVASNANDGDPNTFSASANMGNTSWTVYLGKMFRIYKVEGKVRDCCRDRFSNVIAWVYTTETDRKMCARFKGILPRTENIVTFNCSPTQPVGNAVQVQMVTPPTGGRLDMVEIKVTGIEVLGETDATKLKPGDYFAVVEDRDKPSVLLADELLEKSSNIMLVALKDQFSAEQSSVIHHLGPTKAADKMITTWMQTHDEEKPFWRAELGGVYKVKKVKIINRKDRTDMFSNIDILASLEPEVNLKKCCHYNGPPTHGEILWLECEKLLTGRYVTVQKMDKGILSCAEIMIYVVVPKT